MSNDTFVSYENLKGYDAYYFPIANPLQYSLRTELIEPISSGGPPSPNGFPEQLQVPQPGGFPGQELLNQFSLFGFPASLELSSQNSFKRALEADIVNTITKVEHLSTPHQVDLNHKGYVLGMEREADNLFVNLEVVTNNLDEYLQGVILAEYLYNPPGISTKGIRLYSPETQDYLIISQLSGFRLLELPIELVNIIANYNPYQWLCVNKLLNKLSNPYKYTNNKVKEIEQVLIEKRLQINNLRDLDSIVNGVKSGHINCDVLSCYLRPGTESLMKAVLDKWLNTISIIDILRGVSRLSKAFRQYILNKLIPIIPTLPESDLWIIRRLPIISELGRMDVLYPSGLETYEIELLIRDSRSEDLKTLTNEILNNNSKFDIDKDFYLDTLLSIIEEGFYEGEIDEWTANRMNFLKWLYSNMARIPRSHRDNRFVDLLFLLLPDIGDYELVYTCLSSLVYHSSHLDIRSYHEIDIKLSRRIVIYGYPEEMLEPILDTVRNKFYPK
jgi:hypothetical protein